MSTKVNAPKSILGVVMVALLVIGSWATTSVRFSSTAKTAASATSNVATPQPGLLSPQGTVDPRCVFQLDGDILASTGSHTPACAFPADDWGTVNCPVPFPGSGGSSDAHSGAIFDDISKTIFTGGGSKDPEAIEAWKWKDGSVPPKDEILNAYAARYGSFLFFGGERIETSGASNIGCWFFVNPVGLEGSPPPTGPFQAPIQVVHGQAMCLHRIWATSSS